MSNFIVKQVNTEKTYKLQEQNIYVFLFPKTARKDAIKKSIEEKFSVKVDDVKTIILPRKEKSFRGVSGTLTQYKKAYSRVAKGMKINIEDKGVNKQ